MSGDCKGEGELQGGTCANKEQANKPLINVRACLVLRSCTMNKAGAFSKSRDRPGRWSECDTVSVQSPPVWTAYVRGPDQCSAVKQGKRPQEAHKTTSKSPELIVSRKLISIPAISQIPPFLPPSTTLNTNSPYNNSNNKSSQSYTTFI